MPRWQPESDADRNAVRAQVERMMAHPLFRNSKRYPALLDYVVNETLEGRAEQLKERTIGIEVFERDPDYDTSSDHIVRTTAGEIRKRLAQYYLDPAHANEVRVDLPSGSYVPWFFPPSNQEPTELGAPGDAPARRPVRLWAWVVAALAIAAGAMAWTVGPAGAARDSALSRFWRPVVSARGSVLLCIGDPSPRDFKHIDAAGMTIEKPLPATIGDRHIDESMTVPYSDAITLARLTGYLGSRGAHYRIVKEQSAQLPDLREGPAVLIGAADNSWTMRLASQQRFFFEIDKPHARLTIRDASNAGKRDWSVDFSEPESELTEDWGLISRAFDPTTEQMVLVAAGITRFGTLAAGDFLTSETAMARLDTMAPRGWEHKNLQIVFSTRIIKDAPAPPRIVTVHCW